MIVKICQDFFVVNARIKVIIIASHTSAVSHQSAICAKNQNHQNHQNHNNHENLRSVLNIAI
jgi:hypothetical protein